MIQELTYIVYTINQSKHTKVKAGRDGKWHNPCELITWLEAIAECQVKNSQDQYMRIKLQEFPKLNHQNQDGQYTCTKSRLQARLHINCYNLNMKREGNDKAAKNNLHRYLQRTQQKMQISVNR
jgi:hypothetical protein